MIQLSKIVLIIWLIGVFAGHAGCADPQAPLVKPEIIRRIINPNTGESIQATPVSTAAPGNPGAPPLKPEIVRRKIDGTPQGVKTTPVSGGDALPVPSPKQLPDGGARADALRNKPTSEGPNPSLGKVVSASGARASYNPEGKIDPFVPLLRDEPLKPLPDTRPKREKREPTTPLERVDLSQLKLTAIIRTPSGFKAMVEEATGKGYIITVGTYVGIHSGKVTNILKDRVVVEEEVEDAQGNFTNRNSELKFQKPPGEL